MKEVISTDATPAAVGVDSQATATADPVFAAGRIPLTPEGDLPDDADALPSGVAVEIEAVPTR